MQYRKIIKYMLNVEKYGNINNCMEKIQSIKLKIFKRLSSEYNFCFKEYLKLKTFIYKNITSVIIF